jgi:hypothetical protein
MKAFVLRASFCLATLFSFKSMSIPFFLRVALCCAWLAAGLSAQAQPAYSGPPGAEHMQRAKKLQASGDRAGAAAAYQQAYAAYTSVDDSDGMKAALAGKAAVAAGAAPAPPAAPLATVRPVGAARPALPAAARPAAVAAPLASRVVGGRPVGLFFMTRYIMAWHSLEKATWYFAPDGRVFHNPGSLDAAGYAALPPADRGTLRPGSSTLTWANGQSEKFVMEDATANSFNYDMGIFVGMGPFKSTRELVGRFEGGNSITGAASVSSLDLRADGSYSGGSAASVSATSNESTVRAGSSNTAAGRWALSGWVLTLTDAAGQPVRRGLAYPIERDAKTGQFVRFYFDNVAYKRL